MYHTHINSGIAHNHYTSITSTFLRNSPRANSSGTTTTPKNTSQKTHPREGSSFVHTITRFLHDSSTNPYELTSHSKKSHLEFVEKIRFDSNTRTAPTTLHPTAQPIHCIRRATAHPIPSSIRFDPSTRSNRTITSSSRIQDTI